MLHLKLIYLQNNVTTNINLATKLTMQPLHNNRRHITNKISQAISPSSMLIDFLILSQVFTFYTVIMNTDFENIKRRDHFRSQYSLLLYKMWILETKLINSFAKSVKIDDGVYSALQIEKYRFVVWSVSLNSMKIDSKSLLWPLTPDESTLPLSHKGWCVNNRNHLV